MIKLKKIIFIYIFLLLIPYSVYGYNEPMQDNPQESTYNYKSIDELLKELKEERRLIDQQKLEEINQKKLEKESENAEKSPENTIPEQNNPKKTNQNENIPKLIVRLRGKHSPKYLCSYELTINDDNKEIELSKDIIPNYASLLKKPSLKVRPGENINFEFVPGCKTINAYIWDSQSDELKEIKVKRGCIIVPNIDKKIVIVINGNYSNGYIKYAIVLDIRK